MIAPTYHSLDNKSDMLIIKIYIVLKHSLNDVENRVKRNKLLLRMQIALLHYIDKYIFCEKIFDKMPFKQVGNCLKCIEGSKMGCVYDNYTNND